MNTGSRGSASTTHTSAAQTESQLKNEYPSDSQYEGHKYPSTKNKEWGYTGSSYQPSAPSPSSPEDVRNLGRRGRQRMLEVLEPTQLEVDAINRLIDGDLSPEQIADQNYLVRYRMYHNSVKRGLIPNESEAEFVRNVQPKKEHSIHGGKYIYTCSAAGGIMYLSWVVHYEQIQLQIRLVSILF